MDIVIYLGILFGCLLRTDGYCDLSFDALQLLDENCFDYYDYHLMLFSCLWRTDVIIVDYLLMLFSCLYRTEVIIDL